MNTREQQRRRIVAIILHRRTLSEAADEAAASDQLGYAPRPDHPWSAPLNKATPSGFQADDGGCLGQTLDGENLTP